jgi:hypothetical protein
MARYMLSYDAKRVRNYPRLYRLLKAWHAQPLLESQWVALLRGPAGSILQIMASQMDGDDAVVVTEIPANADWATLRAKPQGVAVLKSTPYHAVA